MPVNGVTSKSADQAWVREVERVIANQQRAITTLQSQVSTLQSRVAR